ncbi:energy-coupling factor transporter transmembrane component T family protein [Haloimpatiens sp. FM7330]|uniref:energy-coupling factor transporter transmembrane component T family protein n=1 Tax=Haloimpatiens sp. FM7330 TaxID=3298610 RepID=UPI003624EF43
MLVYRERQSFIQKLHPLTNILMIMVYFFSFLLINNPIYLIIMLFSLISLSIVDGCISELLSYVKMILPFAILIMILNPILYNKGDTILYEGIIRITLEAVLYGIFSGIRIVCITLVLGFGNLILHPDRSFSFLSKYLKKTGFLMNLIIRLFPEFIMSYDNISQIEKLRGNSIEDKSFIKKIKGIGSSLNILFLSSLEDSQDRAEAMYARGYGIGKKSSYFDEKFKLWDIIFILFALSIFVYIVLFNIKGYNSFNFYPLVDSLIHKTSIFGWILCATTFIPTIVNWGWNLWKS